MQLRKFAVAAVVAGIGDERGSLGGLGLRLRAGGLSALEGGEHIEGEAGALKRQVREGEPHLPGDDVLHLGEIGAETLDEVRLAGSGAASLQYALVPISRVAARMRHRRYEDLAISGGID